MKVRALVVISLCVMLFLSGCGRGTSEPDTVNAELKM